MKKIILAICMCCLAVTSGFAKDIVKTPEDKFDVRGDYLIVPGFSDQQIDDIINALFDTYHQSRFNPETNTFRLSLMDFIYAFERADIKWMDTDLALQYVFGVLENATKAQGIAEINQNKYADLTKFTKTYIVAPDNNLTFLMDYRLELKRKYCPSADFVIVDSPELIVKCGSVDLVKDASEQARKEFGLFLYSEAIVLDRYMASDGKRYEKLGWDK